MTPKYGPPAETTRGVAGVVAVALLLYDESLAAVVALTRQTYCVLATAAVSV